jgi:hypothetical protein
VGPAAVEADSTQREPAELVERAAVELVVQPPQPRLVGLVEEVRVEPLEPALPEPERAELPAVEHSPEPSRPEQWSWRSPRSST